MIIYLKNDTPTSSMRLSSAGPLITRLQSFLRKELYSHDCGGWTAET